MRMRNKPWAEDELKKSNIVILDKKNCKGSWSSFFKNENEVHLEIGCGKGKFITETAEKNKNINYIGIEKNKNVLVLAVQKLKKEQSNVGFILGDAHNITSYFLNGELSRIYINFCDPWEGKKKWAKRRLTHRNFLNLYKSLGKKNIEVFLKTDNRELFEFSLNEFSNENWKLKNISLDLHNSNYENVITEYEEKFSQKGAYIFRLEAKSL